MVIRINRDPTRAPEGFHRKWRIGAHYFDVLLFGASVGVDPQNDRHPEKIKILGDCAYDAETLVAAEAVDRVLGLELGRARRIHPLREEPGELFSVHFFHELAEIVGAGRFSGKLRSELAHRFQVLGFAENVAQHVQDHGAFVGHQRLKVGRKVIELLGTRKGHAVIGKRNHRHVLHRVFKRSFSGSGFYVPGFGIAREAIADPPVVLGCRAHGNTPPLMSDGVG